VVEFDDGYEFGDEKSARVCRGVLRFWDPRIQDSRTDFPDFLTKTDDSTSTRGWCKMGNLIGVSLVFSFYWGTMIGALVVVCIVACIRSIRIHSKQRDDNGVY
jgi:hypothetical protein